MPPKGWKKNKAAAPATPKTASPGEKILKDLDTKVKKTLRKGAEQLTKAEARGTVMRAPIPPGFVEDTTRKVTVPDVVNEVSKVFSVLVSARAALTGAPQEIQSAIDTAILNATNHLDLARSWLPLGAPAGEKVEVVTGIKVETLPVAQEPAGTAQEAVPAPTQAPAPIAVPAQAPAPYGAPPPTPLIPATSHLPS